MGIFGRRWLAAALLASACQVVADAKPDVAAPSKAAAADADAVVLTFDTAVEPDATVDEAETALPDLPQTCPSAAGCPCTEGATCSSGVCLDSGSGPTCAQACSGDCPSGQVCKEVATAGGKWTKVCVGQFGHLCDPCQSSGNCFAAGLGTSLCIDYGKGGRFCGILCTGDGDCGEGYKCRGVSSVDGQKAKQCVRKDADGNDFGTCPCSAHAVKLGLSTVCTASFDTASGQLACKGVRKCGDVGEKGLTACIAAAPATETCDNADNDCDGQTDEGTCDDGNPCTTDKCGGNAGCVHVPLDNAPCEDGDPCTGGEICSDGKCQPTKFLCECQETANCAAKGDGDLCNGTLFCDKSKLPYVCAVDLATVVTCDSSIDTSCATNLCDPSAGKCALKPKVNGLACDDGKPCTSGDACQAGACKSGKNLCECQANADCAAKEDGDLCNGTLYCNKLAFPYKCDLDLTTIKVCATDKDTACSQTVCVPKTGKCELALAKDGTACDADGNACTKGDACLAGVCKAGPPSCACKSDADCAAVDDLDFCNGKLACNQSKGLCETVPETVVKCPTELNTECKTYVCKPATGQCSAVAAFTGTPCQQGVNTCGGPGAACSMGTCGGFVSNCPCKSDLDCLDKDDGNACNGIVKCVSAYGKCVFDPNSVVSCDHSKDSACLANQCNTKTGGCAMQPKDGPCDDNNPCTANESCANGVCQAAANACPCASNADCKAQDDGNPCNGLLMCNKSSGKCEPDPATVIDCGGTVGQCLAMQCQVATGQCAPTALHQGWPCDDANSCTSGEYCQYGSCMGGSDSCVCTAKGCDDGNPCTLDACEVMFCKHTVLAGPCNDGNEATVNDQCAGGLCVPGAPTTNASGCPVTGGGATCANGKGTCFNGHCLQTDAKGYTWTLVPAGSFWMGCNAAADKDCQANEKPQHAVELAAYWIGVYELTADLYKACVAAGGKGCTPPANVNGANGATYGAAGKDLHPVNWVGWAQAQAACNWLGGDLPTEAQWEKAARGGCEWFAADKCPSSEPVYPWGNADPTCGAQAVFFNAAAGCGSNSTYPIAAGSKAGQSRYGSFDMGGNVAEWVLDWYGETFYASAAAGGKDPVNGTVNALRVVRGGGANAGFSTLRAANRGTLGASDSDGNVGVRCARPYP